MRLLLIVLVLLTAITQYPLWWGKGGWLRVQELEKKVAAQKDNNQALLARNNALQAEVDDLKTGTQAIEERARGELGLVKPGDAFVQILTPHNKLPRVKTPELASPKEKPGN